MWQWVMMMGITFFFGMCAGIFLVAMLNKASPPGGDAGEIAATGKP